MGETRKHSMWGAAALMVILVMTLVAKPAEAVGGATLVVEPSTGLVDLQQVTITGSGFAAGASYGVCQAIEGSIGTDTCGAVLAFSTTSDGSFTVTRSVRQSMFISRVGRVVDCRPRPVR